jgi:hypothetical protein
MLHSTHMCRCVFYMTCATFCSWVWLLIRLIYFEDQILTGFNIVNMVISTKFKLMSMDSATVSKFQPFTVKKLCASFLKFWDIIAQLQENYFNLTPQTLKSVQHIMELERKLLVYKYIENIKNLYRLKGGGNCPLCSLSESTTGMHQNKVY